MRDPSDTDAQYMARIALLGFFLLTFAFTWTAWLAPAATGTARFFGVGGPVFLLGVFAPAFVALALTAHSKGRAGVARLLARIGKWYLVDVASGESKVLRSDASAYRCPSWSPSGDRLVVASHEHGRSALGGLSCVLLVAPAHRRTTDEVSLFKWFHALRAE